MFDPRPELGEKGVKLDPPQVAKPQMHDPRRRSVSQDAQRKIGVFGDHDEIVLTGVHLGHYGIDRSKGKPKAEWRRLWHLLDLLDGLPGDFRIRLSSLEAAEARDDLVRAMADPPRICCSDESLKRGGR